MRTIAVTSHIKHMNIEDSFIFTNKMLDTDDHKIDLVFKRHNDFTISYLWDREAEKLIVSIPSGEIMEYGSIALDGELNRAILLSWYHVYVHYYDELDS